MKALQFGTGEKNKFNILESLEIPLWIQRPAHLFLLKPRAYARIWVVLSKELRRSTHQAYTIYKGMLNVLEIPEPEFSYAWLKSANPKEYSSEDYINMITTINRFSPENILILGKELGENWQSSIQKKQNGNVFATYHPEELQAFPQYKKEAYRCLLALKQALHRGEVIA